MRVKAKQKSYLRGKRYQSEKKKDGERGEGKKPGQNVQAFSGTAEKLAAEFQVDHRPLVITGSIGGVVVATDRAAEHWKAERIAHDWRQSGLEVAIVEKTTA